MNADEEISFIWWLLSLFITISRIRSHYFVEAYPLESYLRPGFFELGLLWSRSQKSLFTRLYSSANMFTWLIAERKQYSPTLLKWKIWKEKKKVLAYVLFVLELYYENQITMSRLFTRFKKKWSEKKKKNFSKIFRCSELVE